MQYRPALYHQKYVKKFKVNGYTFGGSYSVISFLPPSYLESIHTGKNLLPKMLILSFNPIALRKTKIVSNFGLSECNRVESSLQIIRGSKQVVTKVIPPKNNHKNVEL